MSCCPTFHFITLFPELISPHLKTSIVGRAYESGLFDFKLHQLRDFAEGKYRSVDDSPYGGGGGMVLRPEPLVAAIEAIQKNAPRETCVIYFTPTGQKVSQPVLEQMERKLSSKDLLLVCGHYEGVDQRFLDQWVDLEISLGDFVLTGGEIPALALTDALIRRIPGALGDSHAIEKESFTLVDPDSGRLLLEYPQYTRPSNFRGLKVPEVLLEGNHQKIAQWRLDRSRDRSLS